uniref:Replication-associated protein n=1 Tax=Maize streak Reunion virus TaxID=1182518 RepID=X2EXW4_9GEMI|nr:replication associated protein [Maize streak Reunion virus]AHM88374.1 replication associated protein [Maize streak Reunion virus]
MSAFGNHFVPTPFVQAEVPTPLPGSDYPSEEDDLLQHDTPVGPDPPRRNFQFKSANAFLTYPRCLLTPFEAGQHLWEVARPWTPSYILASSESHQDGTPHLHVLLQTIRPMSTRDPGFFDIQGYHPNIQASRSPNKTREYILKSPITVYSRGTFIPRAGTSGAGYGSTPVPKRNEIMRGIIETTTSKAEYLSEVQKAFPFEWATKLQQFEYSAERLFPTLPSPFVPPHPPSEPDLNCYETIRSWKDENIFQGDAASRTSRPRSLYIVGPTRTGKTTWARSIDPVNHNYWQNGVDFLKYRKSAKYNVLDDIPFKFCPCWKQLVGGQKDYTVNPKYARRMEVPGGIPSIILVNYDEDWLKVMTPAQLEYFYDNCVVYQMELHEKFYTPS